MTHGYGISESANRVSLLDSNNNLAAWAELKEHDDRKGKHVVAEIMKPKEGKERTKKGEPGNGERPESSAKPEDGETLAARVLLSSNVKDEYSKLAPGLHYVIDYPADKLKPAPDLVKPAKRAKLAIETATDLLHFREHHRLHINHVERGEHERKMLLTKMFGTVTYYTVVARSEEIQVIYHNMLERKSAAEGGKNFQHYKSILRRKLDNKNNMLTEEWNDSVLEVAKKNGPHTVLSILMLVKKDLQLYPHTESDSLFLPEH